MLLWISKAKQLVIVNAKYHAHTFALTSQNSTLGMFSDQKLSKYNKRPINMIF